VGDFDPATGGGFSSGHRGQHCSYRFSISKKQILIANDLFAAKYYLSG
jgi:hypothetical protein